MKKEKPEPLRECAKCKRLFECPYKAEQIHSTKPCLWYEPYREGIAWN